MKSAQILAFLLFSLASLYGGQTNSTAITSGGLWTTNKAQLRTMPPPSADDAAIAAVMVNFQNAVRAGDFTYAVEVMYAPYLEKLGGRDRAIAAAKSAPAQMKAQQIRFVSWTALRPYKYVVGKQRYYAIVRFEAVLESAGKRAKLRSYLLGIRTRNTPWQFVNGDGLTTTDFTQFFPDFPRNVSVPAPAAIPQ